MREYLQDEQFLKNLQEQHLQTTQVKLIALSNDEIPLESLEGRAQSGSISVQGGSSLRRSCQITMAVLNTDTIVTDKYWAFNRKFKVEIGLENSINSNYPSFIWIPQGVFVIQSFSKAETTNSLTVSIQGQDKMCRLNGTISGSVLSRVDFGKIEILDEDGNITYKKLPIKDIITEALVKYAQEPVYNIRIKDLPDFGYELMTYWGKDDLFAIIDAANTTKVYQYAYSKDFDLGGGILISSFYPTKPDYFIYGNEYKEEPTTVYKSWDKKAPPCYLIKEEYRYKMVRQVEDKEDKEYPFYIDEDDKETKIYVGTEKSHDKTITVQNFQGETTNTFYSLGSLNENYNRENATIVEYNNKKCYVVKLVAGQDIGYHQIDLVYSDDLILEVGDSIDTLFNKIATMLGNYEYFYDVNGLFIFQKKKTYTQELLTPFSGEFKTPAKLLNKYSYYFNNKELFTSINNTPDIANVRNDFSVWGSKEIANGATFDFHVRYAIDNKPQKYTQIHFTFAESCKLIFEYQRKLYNELNIINLNPTATPEEIKKTQDDYTEKVTAYQKKILQRTIGWFEDTKTEEDFIFTTDKYDWREILYRMASDYYYANENPELMNRMKELNPNLISIDGKTGYEQYYIDIYSFWRDLYNPYPTGEEVGQYFIRAKNGKDEDIIRPYDFWNKDIIFNSPNINFWFDFIEPNGELANYSVKNIGSRTKAIKENTIKSIYTLKVPEALIALGSETPKLDKNYPIMRFPENSCYISTTGGSAIEKVNTLFNQFATSAQSYNITSIPIYTLETNTRIYIDELKDCTLDTVSFSLGNNGTMQISGSKITDIIY